MSIFLLIYGFKIFLEEKAHYSARIVPKVIYA